MSKYKSADAVIMFDVSGTPTVFGQIKDFNLQVDKKTIDATAMDEEWESVLHGSKSWSGSVTVFFDPADSVQAQIESDLITNNSDAELTFRPLGTGVGKKEYTGSAVVTGWNPAGAKDDLLGLSLQLKGNGALTPATQSA